MPPPPSFRTLLSLPTPTLDPTSPTTALLIIDAQNEYKRGALAVANVESSAAAIQSVLSKFRDAAAGGGGGKVVHILHQTPEGAPIFTPGSGLEEEFEGLEPRPNEPTIHKPLPGAFTSTPLHTTLQSWGINTVVLVGYMAHVCVSTTAREAFQSGYEVVLVADAIGDRDIPGLKEGETVSGAEVTRVALAELGDVFGRVVGSGEV